MSDVSNSFSAWETLSEDKPLLCIAVRRPESPPRHHGAVVKADLRTGTSKVWLKDAEDQLCAEPILVNKPGYAKEDEGVLIVPVITTRDNDHPYVVILDAETMEEQARFTIPQSRIPFGFHAHYTPSKDCR
ncbi:hypothetical protein RB195_011774 [Necator americanus]|uniref:Dioxygenase n=1 Tax=Necator americanus TaxID=51031 RepID=A0ABR1D4V2_NECAM